MPRDHRKHVGLKEKYIFEDLTPERNSLKRINRVRNEKIRQRLDSNFDVMIQNKILLVGIEFPNHQLKVIRFLKKDKEYFLLK